MKTINPLSIIVLPLMFTSVAGVSAQQDAPPPPASEVEVTSVVAEPTAAPADDVAVVAETAVVAESAQDDSAPVEEQAPDDAAADDAAQAAAPATSLTVAEIMRRPASEWDALIEQKAAELQAQREAAFPTRSPWEDPYGRWMSSRVDAMEQRMEARYQKLQRRVDSWQRLYAPAWMSPGYAWSDYQRKLSRLQSLAEQERYEKMMQRYMNRGPMTAPVMRAPMMRGPWMR